MVIVTKQGKRYGVCLALFFLLFRLSAQKYDYLWLSGYDSNVGYDSLSGYLYGTSILDFSYSPCNIRYDSLAMNFDNTNTSYCDFDGRLLFYTNGIYIANTLNEKIKNSDSLNTGFVQDFWDPTIQTNGYRQYQGALALQSPSEQKFYLLHSYMDSFWNGTIYCRKLLYTSLDMSLEMGHGEVLDKNQILIADTLGWELSADKHGNGRDWWVLAQQRSTNCYYRILLNDSGVNVLPGLTCGGSVVNYSNIGSCCFSPDGLKYVYLSIPGGINIFDFDRCLGTLSNPVYIPIPVFGDSIWIANGVSISPNNRFLYVGATRHVYQYDLWASDIAASIDTVAVYDGHKAPFGSFFHTMQLGPDGKIYESCGNSENVYHLIERPDEKGDSCLFIQHGVQLPTFSLGVPNFPNYRLGALPGSPCDTLTGLAEEERAEKEKLLKVFPKPASDYVTIDYGYTDWNKGGVVLEIVNETGQVAYTQMLPMYSGFQKINITPFATGIYSAYIKRNNQIVATARFAKQ